MKKPCWRLHGDIFIVVILFLVPLSTYFSLTPAFCATLHVPAEYSSIRAAMDGAINGDIILVADGIYTGPDNKNLDYQGKAITVQSERGPANCIIDCEGSGRAFRFVKGKARPLSCRALRYPTAEKSQAALFTSTLTNDRSRVCSIQCR